MQNLHIGVPLNHNIRDRDLHITPVTRDFAAHSSHHSELDLGFETGGHWGN